MEQNGTTADDDDTPTELKMSYFRRFWVSLDDFVESLMGRGIIGLTISTQCYIAMVEGGPKYLILLGKALNKIAKNHCHKAMMMDRARGQVVVDRLAKYPDLPGFTVPGETVKYK